MQRAMTSTTATRERHPRGLTVLFFTEMWERFSYYLMIGIFMQYLLDSQTGGMGWDGPKAAGVVGTYLALVYFTPFLGGIIAERWLGYRACVVGGGLFMGLGHILLALPGEAALYAALGSLIVGNGLFKPNMATLVGRLYPAGSPLRDRGYTIFYMGVNVGAFICAFVASVVRNAAGWHWAFATAGFGMALGIVIFVAGGKLVKGADISRAERASRTRESLAPLAYGCLLPALALAGLGYFLGVEKIPPFHRFGHPTNSAFLLACLPVIGFYLRIWRGLSDPRERSRVSALLAIFAVVIVFWSVFKQNSTALTAWAQDETDRRPGALVAPVTGWAPQFAETAPPAYFYNADASVPRPDRSMFTVVGPEAYERLKAEKRLAVEHGKATPVTQEILDKVFAGATPATEALPPGEQLRLVNTELLQAINPGFIILFAPIMVGLWNLLNRRRREPSMPAKIGIGLFITGLSALVMFEAARAQAAAGGGKVSVLWLFGTYGVITIGELCLSPIGLSMVSKMAPVRMTAFLMGGWHLSTSMGNKLSGVFGEMYFTLPHTTFFLMNAGICVAAAAAIWAMLPWLRRQMGSADVPAEPREASAEVPVALHRSRG
jgi:POT family proton-dependent oligopeptide transporter